MKVRRKIKFGNVKDDIDGLAQKVLLKQKTATSSLLDYYRLNLKEPSQLGDCFVVLDSSDKEIAVVRITKIKIVKFQDVSELFAIEEGDGCLDNWLKIHREYYSNQLLAIGGKLEGNTELVCEWFEVVS
ncbi:MAG: ASCH domain-containing protein [Dysgonomonas sp.]